MERERQLRWQPGQGREEVCVCPGRGHAPKSLLHIMRTSLPGTHTAEAGSRQSPLPRLAPKGGAGSQAKMPPPAFSGREGCRPPGPVGPLCPQGRARETVTSFPLLSSSPSRVGGGTEGSLVSSKRPHSGLGAQPILESLLPSLDVACQMLIDPSRAEGICPHLVPLAPPLQQVGLLLENW